MSCVAVVRDHFWLDNRRIVKSKLVIDTRNAVAGSRIGLVVVRNNLRLTVSHTSSNGLDWLFSVDSLLIMDWRVRVLGISHWGL